MSFWISLAIVLFVVWLFARRARKRRERERRHLAYVAARERQLAARAEQRSFDERFWQQVQEWPDITAREFDAASIPDVPEGLYDGLPDDQIPPSERESD